jgi:ygbB family
METYSVILCCAGKSARFGSGTKKEYLPLQYFTPNAFDANISVLSECVAKFLKHSEVKNIVIVIPQGHTQDVQALLQSDSRTKHLPVIDTPADTIFSQHHGSLGFIVNGGATRQQSVLEGLRFLNTLSETQKTKYVLIHDAARPFFSSELIHNISEAIPQFDAVIPGLPVTDTQKYIGEDFCVCENISRSKTRAVQTPQAFKLSEIYLAHCKANPQKNYTDDGELFFEIFPEKKIRVIEGELTNKKITYPEDASNMISIKKTIPQLKIGFGYDIHRLVKGRKLIIGGVQIESEKGFLAHSDGDVLLHAITDALLGAASFSDIGELFSPSDDTWKNANSGELLKKAWAECQRSGQYEIQNMDCVLVMEAPKLLPYRDAIRNSIADILGIQKHQVFVKAKTAEKLGAVGKGKAIEAFATVLLSDANA